VGGEVVAHQTGQHALVTAGVLRRDAHVPLQEIDGAGHGPLAYPTVMFVLDAICRRADDVRHHLRICLKAPGESGGTSVARPRPQEVHMSWWEADNDDPAWYNQSATGPAMTGLWDSVSSGAASAWDTVSSVASDPQGAWDNWDWRKQNIGKGYFEE
jgi:hypothetical protein